MNKFRTGIPYEDVVAIKELSNKKRVKCPIGLEERSDFCSAGYCDVCKERRKKSKGWGCNGHD